jgi:hypothetical protein
MERVRERFNEGTRGASLSGFVSDDDTLLLWINEAIDDIAADGRWKTTGTVDLVSGTSLYSLTAELSDPIRIHEVRLTSTGDKLEGMTNRSSLANILADESTGTPDAYFVQGDSLELAPAPDTTTASGLTIYYTTHPGYVDCVTGDAPSTPVGLDALYEEFCLARAFEKDRRTSGAAERSMSHFNAYLRKKALLFADKPKRSLRPYR